MNSIEGIINGDKEVDRRRLSPLSSLSPSSGSGERSRSREPTSPRPARDDSLDKTKYHRKSFHALDHWEVSASPKPDRLDIRSVTSTLYDRHLIMQKNADLSLNPSRTIDKSPSSPVITRHYLDSLKPTSSSRRVTKSAENSPSRANSSVCAAERDTEARYDFLSSPYQGYSGTADESDTRSWENVMSRSYLSDDRDKPRTVEQPKQSFRDYGDELGLN